MPNHFHLLLRTAATLLSTLMRRLLARLRPPLAGARVQTRLSPRVVLVEDIYYERSSLVNNIFGRNRNAPVLVAFALECHAANTATLTQPSPTLR
jgi:hypothetical protein